jgi:NAD(P)-dependent dehydrogenase (short-subunit alcohol dehydrogenase family)
VSDRFDLGGKVAVVTGASRGLGARFALALAQAGADVIVTSRTADGLAATVSAVGEVGRTAVPLVLDVRSDDSIAAFADAAVAAFGRVDVLVNNAGCNVRKPAIEVTPDDWDRVVDTNLRGSFFVATAIGRHMLARGAGRVINIGSVTSVFGYGGIAPYCASRGGVKQMTMALADEWGPHGVTVNCLAPGWFETEQNRVLYEDPEWVAGLVERIPMRRPGAPGDLDGAVVFLASDASEYVTGQTLLVDGGITTGSIRASPHPPAT